MEVLFESGLETIRWLQATYPQLRGLMEFISELGRFELYLMLVLLIYWTVNKGRGKHLAYLLGIGSILIAIGKHSFRSPRPYWIDETLGVGETEGYGIPSGHTTTVILAYTYIAWWLKRRWATVLCVFMIIAMTISRIYLGQHFLQDSAAALLLSGVILLGYWAWQQYAAAWFQELILGQRFWVAVGIPVAFAFLYALIRIIIGPPNTTVAWADEIAAAELSGIEEVVSYAAILLGLGMGFILEPSRVRFLIEGAWWKKVVRYVLGLGITLLFLYGLRSLFASLVPFDVLWVTLWLRFIRYFIVSIWAAFYAPMVFVRLGLAAAAPEPVLKTSLNRLQPPPTPDDV